MILTSFVARDTAIFDDDVGSLFSAGIIRQLFIARTLNARWRMLPNFDETISDWQAETRREYLVALHTRGTRSMTFYKREKLQRCVWK